MKFLAVLRDSFREATDGKIFPVMLVMSALFVALIGSISLKPVTPRDQVEYMYSWLTWGANFNPNIGPITVTIEDETQDPPNVEPWKASHSFTVVVRADSEEKLKAAGSANVPINRGSAALLITEVLSEFKTVTVAAPDESDPAARSFQVTASDCKVDEPLAWPHVPKIFFSVPLNLLRMSPREAVFTLETTLFGTIGAWVFVMLGVVISASFVPNLLQRGAIDLMLVKPLRRTELFLYKFIGGLSFVFFLTAFNVSALWLIIGLRSGIWSPNFLFMIPALTFSFAVLYSVSTLAGVLSRSPLVAILATCLVWFLFFLNGTFHNAIEESRKAEDKMVSILQPSAGKPEEGQRRPPFGLPSAAITIADVIYAILPRTTDLDRMTKRWIAQGVLTPEQFQKREDESPPPASWSSIILVSSAFIVIMLGLASWRFASRDY